MDSIINKNDLIDLPLIDQKIKDVTCRYAEKWLSFNRKLRIDRDWWGQTLQQYQPEKSLMDNAEDAKLKRTLLAQDFPKSIGDFKNHPLYALQRHLLKFEAIYPADAAPLGFIRQEAIFPRECVHEVFNETVQLKTTKWSRVYCLAFYQ